jgi:hypothetical protein
VAINQRTGGKRKFTLCKAIISMFFPLSQSKDLISRTEFMATPDGMATPELVEYHRSFARGGAGIVTVGDSAVNFAYGKNHEAQLNLGTDEVITSLSRVVEGIARYGAMASIELNHGEKTPGGLKVPHKDAIKTKQNFNFKCSGSYELNKTLKVCLTRPKDLNR